MGITSAFLRKINVGVAILTLRVGTVCCIFGVLWRVPRLMNFVDMVRFVLLFVCLVWAVCRVAGQSYAEEADAFLAGMPKGLQDAQRDAIVKAIGGDCGDLDTVRGSRNKEYVLPDGVSRRRIGERMCLFRMEGAGADGMPLLVYLHGGGWTIGSINSCSRYCANMALNGVAVLAVDYRLAPEHRFPEGLQDCIEAVKVATDSAAAWGCGGVSVGGDSSGGNLAIATAMSVPAGALESLVLFYPVTRAYADGSESWLRYGRGYGLDSDLMDAFNEAYTDDRRNGLVSPMDAEKGALSKLPRTLIVAAERDILHCQGRELAERMSEEGVDVTYRLMEGTVHLFITVAGQERAFEDAVKLSSDFIK